MRHLSFPFSLLSLLLLVILHLPAQLFGQVCAGPIILTTQTQIDNFNCTSVTGNIIISGTGITNVDGLSGLTYVGGYLNIFSNSSLANVDGLSGLTYVGGLLSFQSNTLLTNVDGLSSLTSVGGLQIYNNLLTNINGLSNLNSVGGGLSITYNVALPNVDGLSSLSSVGSGLVITNNNVLSDVDGLSRLSSVGGYLRIESNNLLSSFCGLYRLLKSNGPTGTYTVSGNSTNPTQANIIDGGPCPGIPVPTLSEWGLIFLALFLLAFGVVAVAQPSLALAGFPVGLKQGLSLDRQLWLRCWVASLVAASGLFALAVVLMGYEMTWIDLCCTPVAAAVAAFVLGKVLER